MAYRGQLDGFSMMSAKSLLTDPESLSETPIDLYVFDEGLVAAPKTALAGSTQKELRELTLDDDLTPDGLSSASSKVFRLDQAVEVVLRKSRWRLGQFEARFKLPDGKVRTIWVPRKQTDEFSSVLADLYGDRLQA